MVYLVAVEGNEDSLLPSSTAALSQNAIGVSERGIEDVKNPLMRVQHGAGDFSALDHRQRDQSQGKNDHDHPAELFEAHHENLMHHPSVKSFHPQGLIQAKPYTRAQLG